MMTLLNPQIRTFYIFLLVLFAYVLEGSSQLLLGKESQTISKPNILFIYADDWGWGDLACHGHPDLKTPNLDRLAREGTDFHQFMVCNPVCSPSRVAIVTGQYPARHLVHQHFATHDDNVARGMPDWLDPKVTVLPRVLKEAGYATGHFGKWHLSGQGKIDAPLPSDYGYDEAAVWTGPGRDVFEGTSVADKVGTAHDKIGASFQTIAAAEHALRFIRQAGDRPFYVNFWMHETHHLVSATDEQKAPYPNTPEPQRTYYSAVTRADSQIGRLLDLLDELKIADHTIVIFSSDNGPENSMEKPEQKLYYSVGVTGGLSGRKRSLYMGGVNVPFLVRWPGRIPAGRVDTTSILAGVDVMPTLLSAIGLDYPIKHTMDGVNAMAAFEGKPFRRNGPLFWEWRGPNAQVSDWPQLAMRDDFFSLIMNFDQTRVELYDLANDRAQQTNLASSQPERVQLMSAAIRAWQATLPAPPRTDGTPVVPARKAKTNTAANNKEANPSSTNAKVRSNNKDQDRVAIFKRWDTNQDGSLSIEEYRSAIRDKERAVQRFNNFDKSGDGLLSQNEFANVNN